MKEFTFIRHCESQGNAGLSTHQPQTISLTEKGFRQAELIARLFDNSPDLIVTSPFLRTKQTAQPTVEKFPNARCEEWQVHEFTYLSQVKYTDTTMNFRRPFVEEYWNKCDANYCDGDGSESFADFISRVDSLIRRIKEANENTIAIFTHGQFMKAILWVLVNNFPKISDFSMNSYHSFLNSVFLPNAALFKVFVNDGKFLLSGVSTSHLPQELITF